MSAILWMTVLSVLLSWLPVLGPLVAGFVGGRKAGGVGKAILAAILPAIVLGILVFGLVAWLNMPFIGALLGGATTLVILVHAGTLLVGAIVGGALS